MGLEAIPTRLEAIAISSSQVWMDLSFLPPLPEPTRLAAAARGRCDGGAPPAHRVECEVPRYSWPTSRDLAHFPTNHN